MEGGLVSTTKTVTKFFRKKFILNEAPRTETPYIGWRYFMKIYSFILGLLVPVLGFSAYSCSTEIAVEQVLGASTASPVFLSCRAISSTEVAFKFSEPVKVLSLNFEPNIEVDSIGEGADVSINLKQALGEGESLLADILVEDEGKNTLNVLVPFRGRNNRIPSLLINELRTESSTPKVEFIEMRTLGAGNLGALRLFIAGNSIQEPIFEFPPTEVGQGEYIVVHLRTVETDTVNETGADLGASAGTEALPEARDFWVPAVDKSFHKTDAVYLLDQDDKVLDCVVLSEKSDAGWSKEVFADAAKFLAEQSAWLPVNGSAGMVPGPSDAVISAKTTNTRTICRDDSEGAADTNKAADWYITASSNASPGKKNSTKRYSSDSTSSKASGSSSSSGSSGSSGSTGSTGSSNGSVGSSFQGRNDRMPSLLINELRTEASKSKVEFIELKTLGAGNMGALRLFIASYNMKEPIFEFPSTEVKKDEYIVVHLRTLETETGTVNETGTDLGASAGTEASSEARDFWVPTTNPQLGMTDAVFLLDQDNKIVDSVLLSKNADKWSQTVVADAAKFLAEQGAWLPVNGNAGIPGPSDAFIATNTTTTRTICRDENTTDTNQAADWYITANGKATPGTKNNTEKYTE
jgi:uncharacterized membrane protein YgcG